ncbi:hypothetical protein scyTo_0016975 [Scyliorhinus torazame]|uniref:Fanconi anemia core complex-associated protein 24 pseudonuclease domain-containing protein n=1 Tax=Scyliorhinus torazame TaxID=75743 RepID=A0A401Q2B2_SCYTO|nr:hypothetical protein [Scyliorhinus torazame]
MDSSVSPSVSSTPVRVGANAVPYGHVIVNEKWRGSQLAQGFQGRITVIFEDGLGLVDFHISKRLCVLYISEADLVVGNSYKRKLVQFRNVREESREQGRNPFQHRTPSGLSDARVLATVQQIPGVGKVKAMSLLKHFPSIQQLSTASPQELEAVTGQALAQQITHFFS